VEQVQVGQFEAGSSVDEPTPATPAGERQASLVIAVDGPGGSGKSTVAREVARRLGLRYLDTGAMYRALTWLALQRRVDVEDAETLSEMAEQVLLSIDTDPDAPTITIDGEDVTEPIRTRQVTNAVSAVSAVPAVRTELVRRQQNLIAAAVPGIVVEGRDIGSVVVPDAPVKLFLTASTEERARRRSAELGEQGADAVARTHSELERRDTLDSGRSASPLLQAPDALVIDSTTMSSTEVADLVVERVGGTRS
jgi:cytidylate kinase